VSWKFARICANLRLKGLGVVSSRFCAFCALWRPFPFAWFAVQHVSALQALGDYCWGRFPGPSLRSDPGYNILGLQPVNVWLARAVPIVPVPFLCILVAKRFVTVGSQVFRPALHHSTTPGLPSRLRLRVRLRLRRDRAAAKCHGSVTGCHGSCHGLMLRKGPSLLGCHGVTAPAPQGPDSPNSKHRPSLGSFRRRWEAMARQAGAPSKVLWNGLERSKFNIFDMWAN